MACEPLPRPTNPPSPPLPPPPHSQDTGIWPECGNNVRYSRVNTTDPFPASCLLSSSQYKCSTHCCVPTWDALPNGDFGWTSAQSSFFPAKLEHGFATPQFATLTANGSLFFPVGFNRSEMPYTVFTAPVALDATGTAALPHGRPDACDDVGLGANPATGFCLLPADAMPGGLCDCDSCQPHEDFAHLSPIGIAFTIVCTYTGFGLLALAVLWNADVTAKMRGVGTRWRELRARRPPTAPEQTYDYSSA